MARQGRSALTLPGERARRAGVRATSGEEGRSHCRTLIVSRRDFLVQHANRACVRVRGSRIAISRGDARRVDRLIAIESG